MSYAAAPMPFPVNGQLALTDADGHDINELDFSPPQTGAASCVIIIDAAPVDSGSKE